MLISTKGRYALHIMVELAQNGPDSYMSLPLIAEHQEISEKYLESIISVLAKAGFVEGLRGKGGGYRLCRKPGEYTVGEIIRLTEGTLAPVSCLDSRKGCCMRKNLCKSLPIWEKLDHVINDYLDGVTLADVVAENAVPSPSGPRCTEN